MTGPKNSSIDLSADKDKGLKRRKRKSRSAQKPQIEWIKKYWPDLVVAGGATAALLAMTGPGIGWLPAGIGLEWVGLLFLAFTLVFAIIRLRHHIVNKQSWWRRQGCPDCGDKALKRQRRSSLDHLIDKIGIPRRRYMCTACEWRGALVDDARIF